MGKEIEINGFEDFTPENITKGDAYNYLDAVLTIYGPPCDWCEFFKYFCSKKYRPRERTLKFGPYKSWHLRKHCKGFSGKQKDNSDEAIKSYVRSSLDCFVQQYCG